MVKSKSKRSTLDLRVSEVVLLAREPKTAVELLVRPFSFKAMEMGEIDGYYAVCFRHVSDFPKKQRKSTTIKRKSHGKK